jgi:hypothetical protein
LELRYLFLGYDIFSLGVWFWAFSGNVLLLSSRVEMSKKNEEFFLDVSTFEIKPFPYPPT